MHLIGCDPEELGVAGRRCRAASDEEKAGRSEVMCELHDQDPPQTARSRAGQTARVIGQLEAAQDLHQIVNLAPGGGAARFEVLLHTQTSKESQDHTG
jgi:hypothetical protein